jgi:hypothetical protein
MKKRKMYTSRDINFAINEASALLNSDVTIEHESNCHVRKESSEPPCSARCSNSIEPKSPIQQSTNRDDSRTGARAASSQVQVRLLKIETTEINDKIIASWRRYGEEPAKKRCELSVAKATEIRKYGIAVTPCRDAVLKDARAKVLAATTTVSR